MRKPRSLQKPCTARLDANPARRSLFQLLRPLLLRLQGVGFRVTRSEKLLDFLFTRGVSLRTRASRGSSHPAIRLESSCFRSVGLRLGFRRHGAPQIEVSTAEGFCCVVTRGLELSFAWWHCEFAVGLPREVAKCQSVTGCPDHGLLVKCCEPSGSCQSLVQARLGS